MSREDREGGEGMVTGQRTLDSNRPEKYSRNYQHGLNLIAIMPTIFEKDGFRFFIYSNEHRPIHVHVRYGGGEAVFEMENQVELRESQGLKLRELARAEKLAEENKKLIIEKWHEYLG